MLVYVVEHRPWWCLLGSHRHLELLKALLGKVHLKAGGQSLHKEEVVDTVIRYSEETDSINAIHAPRFLLEGASAGAFELVEHALLH